MGDNLIVSEVRFDWTSPWSSAQWRMSCMYALYVNVVWSLYYILILPLILILPRYDNVRPYLVYLLPPAQMLPPMLYNSGKAWPASRSQYGLAGVDVVLAFVLMAYVALGYEVDADDDEEDLTRLRRPRSLKGD